MSFLKTEMLTRIGHVIDLANPNPDSIEIEDIAFSLSNLTRFCGHVPGWNVAQHSVYVADRCDPEYALEGLLHDASEAYCGDMIRPLKAMLGEAYAEIERRIQSAIVQRFELKTAFDAQIKTHDDESCRVELITFWPTHPQVKNFAGRTSIGTLQKRDAEESERLFMDTFIKLWKCRQLQLGRNYA